MEKEKALILIANSDAHQAELTAKALKDFERNFYPVIVSSYYDFLKKIEEEKYDALILHHCLPEMNSLEALKKNEVPPVTLVVTEQGEKTIGIKAQESGVYDYIAASKDCLCILPLLIKKELEKQKLIKEKAFLEKKQKWLEKYLMEQSGLATIGSLIRGMIHNINSPLTAILGRIQLLEMRLKEARKEYSLIAKKLRGEKFESKIKAYDNNLRDIKSITKSSQRLNFIIKNVMYKVMHEQTDKPQQLNINELLMEELTFLEADMFFKHEVEKIYHLDESIPLIEAVYSDFSRSFVGIARNALDSMHDSQTKRLTVTTRQSDNFIFVDIDDTGSGAKEENMGKLSDRYLTTKLLSSPKKSLVSAGMGLAECKALLSPYGVTFALNSNLEYNTVSIRIPAKGNGCWG